MVLLKNKKRKQFCMIFCIFGSTSYYYTALISSSCGILNYEGRFLCS